jgi:ammonia channel protein AmtB
VRHCCNGLLAGLVAITSCAGFVEPWAAVVIGTITGPLYIINSRLLLRLRIDDPLDSSTVHFASGIVGTLAVAFFTKPEYAMSMASNECAGILYVSSGWTQLGVQTLGACCRAESCHAVCVLLLRMRHLRLQHHSIATACAAASPSLQPFYKLSIACQQQDPGSAVIES